MAQRGNRITIQDVSRRAGVSATTVSHALNGRGRVGTETRERVLRAARELGYVANPIARALKSGNSRTLVAELPATTEAIGLDSAFLRDVIVGAAERAIEAGYLLAITSRSSSSTQVLPQHEGVLVVDPVGSDSLAKEAREAGRPVVTVARFAEHPTGVTAVDVDYSRGVRLILDQLAEAGYSRPALLTTSQPFSFAVACEAGYQEWCREKRARRIVRRAPRQPSIESGRAAVRDLLRLKRLPDAIVTATEPLAIGALRGLAEASRRIPDEIGLACATDSERLRSALVPVTALDVHPAATGRRAIEALIELVASEGRVKLPDLIEMPTKLNVRASTMPARRPD